MLQSILNTSKDIRTSKKELSLQILLVFILPIIFFQTGIISVKYRIFVLVLIVTTLLIILFFEKWTPRMLGLTSLNLKKFVVPYGIFTLIGTLSIIRFGEIIGNQEITNWWTHSHFLYLFFVVSFFQEIAYRGYLIPALGKLTNVPIFIIFANIVFYKMVNGQWLMVNNLIVNPIPSFFTSIIFC